MYRRYINKFTYLSINLPVAATLGPVLRRRNCSAKASVCRPASSQRRSVSRRVDRGGVPLAAASGPGGPRGPRPRCRGRSVSRRVDRGGVPLATASGPGGPRGPRPRCRGRSVSRRVDRDEVPLAAARSPGGRRQPRSRRRGRCRGRPRWADATGTPTCAAVVLPSTTDRLPTPQLPHLSNSNSDCSEKR